MRFKNCYDSVKPLWAIFSIIAFGLAPCALGAEAPFIPAETLHVERGFTYPSPEFTLSLPDDIEVLPNGNVIVSDSKNHRLALFDADGKFIKSIGELGSGNSQFYWPQVMAVGQDRLYISDQGNNRIVKLTFGLAWTGSFPVTALPDILTLDSHENVYVGSRSVLPDGYLLVKYSSDGEYLGGIGEQLGSIDDSIARMAVNVVTADIACSDKIVICHKGLAYCRCGDLSWMVNYDVDTTRAWFYRNFFPSFSFEEWHDRNELSDFVEDLEEKCLIDRSANVPLYVDQVIGTDEGLLVVVSSTLHEYSCDGKLLRRLVFLRLDGSRFVFERIALSSTGVLYIMSKYVNPGCWRVNYPS